MNLTETLELIQALASIATVVAVVLAWQQIRLIRKQATTSFEDSLTEHYRRIMESIPTDVWLGSGLNTLDKEHHDKCRDAIYRYIDLCNEQAVLHDMKRVTDESWAEWSKGITVNMELPAFKEVWVEVAVECPKNFRELRVLLGG
jgi:hypothetical protein